MTSVNSAALKPSSATTHLVFADGNLRKQERAVFLEVVVNTSSGADVGERDGCARQDAAGLVEHRAGNTTERRLSNAVAATNNTSAPTPGLEQPPFSETSIH